MNSQSIIPSRTIVEVRIIALKVSFIYLDNKKQVTKRIKVMKRVSDS
jgi:hypothetical protein